MKKLLALFGFLALVQLAAVVVNWQGGQSLHVEQERKQLLAFAPAEIDRVVIDTQDSSVSLKKTEAGWLTQDDFPADASRVETLLSELSNLEHTIPVATSNEALHRFKVTDQAFERRVRLLSGETEVGTLYLGTGAGARQSHARTSKQNAVYSIPLGNYDLPGKAGGWHDKNFLHFGQESITGIEVEGLAVRRVSEKETTDDAQQMTWEATQQTQGTLVASRVDSCVDRLATLSFSSVMEKDYQPIFAEQDAPPAITVEHIQGKRTYRFSKLKDSEDYLLKISDRDEYFQLAGYMATPVIEQCDRAKWISDSPVSVPTDQPKDDEQASE